MKFKEVWLASGAIVVSAGLVGCFGGGGDDDGSAVPPPSNQVSITASNYVEVARQSYGIIGGFLELGSASFGGVLQASSTGGAVSPAKTSLLDLTLEIAKQRIAAANSDRLHPAAVYTEALPCISGSGTVTWNDADNNDMLSAGDTWSESYTNCLISSDGPTLDGALSLSFGAIVGDPSSYTSDWSFSAGITYSAFRISFAAGESTTFNGGYTLADSYTAASNQENVSVHGTALSANWVDSEGTGFARLSNFTLAFGFNYGAGTYTADADYTMDNSELGGTITVVTNPVFAGALSSSGDMGYPTSGAMVATGANNSKAKIEALPDGVNAMVYLDANGDGVYETSQVVAWSVIEGD